MSDKNLFKICKICIHLKPVSQFKPIKKNKNKKYTNNCLDCRIINYSKNKRTLVYI
jgi:hypothetical protein